MGIAAFTTMNDAACEQSNGMAEKSIANPTDAKPIASSQS
jgi:hypothetical protein